MKDRDLRVVSANRAFCDALGVAREDLLGKPTAPLLGDAGPASSRVDREVIESGAPQLGIVESYMAPDGLRWVLTDKVPIKDADGTTIGIVGTSTAITERKRAEDELQRSESRLRFLAEHMADILWTMDLSLRTTFVSASVERILGFTPEERRQQSLEEMVTPESAGRILAALRQHMELEATGEGVARDSLTIEVEYYRTDGSTIWLENSVKAIRSDDGTLIGLLGVSRDITERKSATEALQESEEKYRTLITSINDVVYALDADGLVTFISPQVEALSGIRPEDVVGRRFTEFVHPEDLPAIAQSWARLVKGVMEPSDFRVFDAAGRVRHVRSSSRPHFKEGVFSGAICSLVEITDRVEAQQALRESEQKFRELFEQSVDAINLVSPDGRILEANPAWFRLFGYTPEDMSSYTARDAYADPDGRARFLELIALQDRVEDEIQFKRKDGTVFDCHRIVTVRRAPDDSVIGFQTVFHDITETRKAERALRESEERFRTVLKALR